MNTNNVVNQTAEILGKVATKIAETALHAAVFAYVSKKVSNFMEGKKKSDNDKVRIEANNTDGTKAGG